MSKIVTTLCVVHDDEKLLLGMKKRGFGAGRWNGFGGKVAAGEGIKEAAIRELQEEAGIETIDIEKVGLFTFEGIEESLIEVHLYKIRDFRGEPSESDEMRPCWFNFEKIPYEMMWPDDRHWLPLVLGGRKLVGKFRFEDGEIAEFDLDEVDEIVETSV